MKLTKKELTLYKFRDIKTDNNGLIEYLIQFGGVPQDLKLRDVKARSDYDRSIKCWRVYIHNVGICRVPSKFIDEQNLK